ncbi:hypothetical protein RO3G_15905 [Rhizopus delemar RA 99-880]|uniref:Uncharacterized protein n=1 Tax=Rhizopus delemar (strain RA 99-880 / ATCC MYA-4621 / FGSC 9543 / NRRL 43880) TaxID=246409 RepID=I1CRW4_RHIO9|nr:hypothetical protein RO3G_15905 [Rhizopus delemar RA 99-880]|eukprot:EIE91194.1 hypothetical protein RO3G_15905 [Rhizopus delemar RA 99-880]
MASFFLSENGTPLISPNPNSSRYTSLEVFRTPSMTFLLINRFVTLETTVGLQPVLTVLLENNVINDLRMQLTRGDKNYDDNQLGRIKIHYFKHMQTSKFEIVWCSIHGQAAVKHEFCNSLQHFFDL